jgi:glutamate-5-semialdehyde dehydrogenase
VKVAEKKDVGAAMESAIVSLARRARAAALASARLDADARRRALESMADSIDSHRAQILAANAVDLSAAERNEVTGPMLDRLRLSDAGVSKLAEAVREVAAQEDPLGALEEETVRPNGLRVARMRIPIGVVAMIYESRPNVTSDAAALCIKAGNAVILRGGSEAVHSNRAIAEALREGLGGSDVPVDAVQLIQTTERSAIDVLLEQDQWIDLVIPRGGEDLIRAVTAKSRIPVLQHYKGVCHVFLDESAPLERARDIVLNAKVQRPAVCNALETLLVHRGAAARVLPTVARALVDAGVELRVDANAAALLGGMKVKPATEDDWYAEYLDLTLAVRVVDDLESALDHIARYGSSHTDAIVTEDHANAERFVKAVQSSTVLVNASTRFADGGELGLGAEIGISTSKLHAFGPMGAKELTTRKFVVFGDGQVRR